MKALLCVAMIGAVGYVGWQNLPSFGGSSAAPLRELPYVVVYGRNTCSLTKRLLGKLDNSGVPYEYKIIDKASVKAEIHPRMEEAGISTRRYGLPIVDVNGNIMVRPDVNTIDQEYSQYARASIPQPRKDSGPQFDSAQAAIKGMEAAKRLADPLVPCRINGHDTYTLRSQCPE